MFVSVGLVLVIASKKYLSPPNPRRRRRNKIPSPLCVSTHFASVSLLLPAGFSFILRLSFSPSLFLLHRFVLSPSFLPSLSFSFG